jgi:hypothetical protein
MMEFTQKFFRDAAFHINGSYKLKNDLDLSAEFKRIDVVPFLQEKLGCTLPLDSNSLPTLLEVVFKLNFDLRQKQYSF